MEYAADRTGLRVARGTYEQAKAMIGARSDVHFAEVAVNWPMIKYYCALTEDGNPSYWDEDFARTTWGDIISPPGLAMTWMMPIQWRPGGVRPVTMLATRVPLPGETLINVSTETEFFRPLRLGEQLNAVDELVSVSEEKKTRLGRGHFVTTVTTFRNQCGDVVMTNTNVMLRFSAGAS